MSKVISTIDFSGQTLTIEKGSTIQNHEQLIFKVVDPLGTTIYINAGFITSDFSSPDINEDTSDTLVINLPVDANDKILQGTYTLYYNSLVSGKYSAGEITVRYCIVEPEVEVGLEYSCRTSSITSTDNTEYDIYCSCADADITPSITRTHTVKYPTTMEVPLPDVTDTAAIVIVTPIWTKYWVSRVTSALVYDMPAPSFTGNTTYFITGTITGIADTTVVCDDCLCLLFDCISVVIDKYFSLKETMSPYDLNKYKTTLFDLQTLYMQFAMTEGCATEADTREICGQMRAILAAWDCACDTTLNTPYSTEIVPVAGLGGGSVVIGGTTWYSATGVPSGSLGNLSDFYLNISNGDIYKKTSGGWVLQFSMALTATLGSYIFDANYTDVASSANSFIKLRETFFDEADIEDLSVIKVEANVTLAEPTSVDTNIRLTFTGDTTSHELTIPIDAINDGVSFEANIKADYYMIDNGGVITANKLRYSVEILNTIIASGFLVIDIPLDDVDNTIELYVKSTGTAAITCRTYKVNYEQTV